MKHFHAEVFQCSVVAMKISFTFYTSSAVTF